MAIRRILAKRLSSTLKIDPLPPLTVLERSHIPATPPDSVNGDFFGRFLQRREINHVARLPEFLSIPVGEKLREKLRSMNATGERIRFERLAPPAPSTATALLPAETMGKITVNDAKKILKISQLEKVKSRLREIPMNSISYSEFVEICDEFCCNREQSLDFAKMLDESGSVIVLGDIVFLRPYQVAKSMNKIISESIASPNDPRRRELEQMEKQKALIDQKAQSLARFYSDARPTYPGKWFSMLAQHTTRHSLAWDVGTGNGQAAISLVEHYKKVIATDVSKDQLSHAQKHPRIQYIHTPLSMSDEELVSIVGGENSVNLITVAAAVHWFDLPRFYSIVNRVLRRPGGIIAVWAYELMNVSPEFDPKFKSFLDSTLPYWHPNVKFAFDGYKTLPFPFESVGLGLENEPIEVEIQKDISFDGFLGLLKSLSAINTANEKGVDLLPRKLVEEFEVEWGGPKLVRRVIFKAFMLVGKVKNTKI
ncbi:hypothetical protein KY285_021544 [Solanum tuberosum]|nr:hypothetical protein KY285_021544 [Solanum tuberosum]